MDAVQEMYQAYTEGDWEKLAKLGAQNWTAMATVMRLVESTGVEEPRSAQSIEESTAGLEG